MNNERHRKHIPALVWIGVGIVLALVGAALLRPVINRAREVGRIRQDSNLRQIGQAIALYANDSHGQYPDTFGDLLIEDISSAVFVSPPSGDEPATGATTRDVAANIATPGHCSYVYLGKGLTSKTAQPEMVIAYELPEVNYGDGGYVLFGDGHVEYLKIAKMNSILDQIKMGVWPVYFPARAAGGK